jgi:FkbM family methyltransferase
MLRRLLSNILVRGRSGTLASRGRTNSFTFEEITRTSGVLPLDEINCLVKGRHGWFLANRYDQYLGRALIRYGEYGEVEHAFLNSLLTSGDSIIEVGANIGSHTVGLAKTIGPSGSMIAIEAQPAIFRILCANLALNAVPNVLPHACGCGNYRKTMVVPIIDYGMAKLHNFGEVSLDSSGVGVPVPVVPLDDLIEDISRLHLIKIDVEGMEQEVLQGGKRLIAKYRPLLYVENDRIDKSKSLIELIMSEGYRLWWHAPPLFNPDNYFGIDENDYPNVISLNMFCQPKEATPTLTTTNSTLIEIVDSDYHPFRH